MSLIFPGDTLQIPTSQIKVTGPGIYVFPNENDVKPINAGIEIVQKSPKTSVYIEYNSKRYIPAVGDFVIGTIVAAYADHYNVSLNNFSNVVSLSYMAFPNASKKNRPNLKTGDLVYARVCQSDRDLEAEIECMNSTTGVNDGFGLLDENNSMIIDVSLGFARELLFNNSYPLLPLLSKFTEFEVAIGVNGKIWIKTPSVLQTLASYKSILDCEKNPSKNFKDIIKSNFKKIVNVVADEN
ncbi:probable Exosome complex component RRP40 [Saccharomycodes ludwigii]|uniref:Probable Exosome complex component RRP40 n=1 Tax=Saccharomycodes ludwigii TaxID=36035 RepID=A0A376B541_9ASCO|nr:hypothetical protein SCDLUD_004991 [Saccharomycodes ludwigii]KAH3898669.1 hypothetical protein SCDLUD_004991 [Saccharomycodes ludwigii]SSD59250.1 probable Exosome complex component RRP40 [Saccharomycodes ludwigii]